MSKISAPCPCGGGTYSHCCEPLHIGAAAKDADALMRSRYSAYALQLVDYLLATWHVSTRPFSLQLQEVPPVRWLGLEVRRHEMSGDRAVVEFVARYRQGGDPAVRMHEISRFVRENGRWFYVDGDVGHR